MAIGDNATHPRPDSPARREPARAPESAVGESGQQPSDPAVPETLDDAVMAPAADGTSAAETPGGSDPADDPDRADEGGGDERVQPDPRSRLASADGDHLQPGSWSRLDSADSEQLQPNLWSGLDKDDRRDQLTGPFDQPT